MVLQDPPVVFHKLNKQADVDTNFYKAYTSSGDKVEFLVWPALLHRYSGPVLSKGVVHCYKSENFKASMRAKQVHASKFQQPSSCTNGDGTSVDPPETAIQHSGSTNATETRTRQQNNNMNELVDKAKGDKKTSGGNTGKTDLGGKQTPADTFEESTGQNESSDRKTDGTRTDEQESDRANQHDVEPEEPPQVARGSSKKHLTGKDLDASPTTDNGDDEIKKGSKTDIGIGKTYQNSAGESKNVKDQAVKKNSSTIRTDTGKVEVHSSTASTSSLAAEHNKSQAEHSTYFEMYPANLVPSDAELKRFYRYDKMYSDESTKRMLGGDIYEKCNKYINWLKKIEQHDSIQH